MSDYSSIILRLENPVMEYAWGSKTFIPELLGRTGPAANPAAELWMGAHPRAPSRVKLPGRRIPLDQFIREDPAGTLGPRAAERFRGRLPFLLKILAAERPLSIQAHPNAARARAGYRRENAAGIPENSPLRNYPDPRPKPELICALTPFEALAGFRSLAGIAGNLADFDLGLLLPEAARFLDRPTGDRFRRLLGALFRRTAPGEENLLPRFLDRLSRTEAPRPEAAVAGRLVLGLAEIYPDDPGILAPLFLNFIRLRPGQALSLSPGILHSYLSGAGVEIMGDSDNVLRAGLTAKHLDIPELEYILSYRRGAIKPRQPEPAEGIECVYPSPAGEFQLSRLSPVHSEPFASGRRRGPEIVFCSAGRGRAVANRGTGLSLAGGDSVFIPFGAGSYTLSGTAVLYRAALPPERTPTQP